MTGLQFNELIADLNIETVNVPITKVREKLKVKLDEYISRRNAGCISEEQMITNIRSALDYTDNLIRGNDNDYELVHVDVAPKYPHMIIERTYDWIWPDNREKQVSDSFYGEMPKEAELKLEHLEVLKLKKQYEEALESLNKERKEQASKIREMEKLCNKLERELEAERGTIGEPRRDIWIKRKSRISAFCRITIAIAILIMSVVFAYRLIG